jgi:multidrug resistance efflux pump
LSILIVLSLVLFLPVVIGRRSSESVAVPFSGKPVRTFVTPGQRVAAGAVLAELDTRAYRDELDDLEAELQALQTNMQDAINPVAEAPMVAGVLPSELPKVETIRVPVNPPKPQAKKVAVKLPPKRDAAALKDAVADAQENLDRAIASVTEASEAKASLEPKVAEAEETAEATAKKAASARDLFDQGVISEKRAQQLQDLSDQAQKNLENLKALLADSTAKLESASKSRDTAQSRLESATLALSQKPTPQSPPAGKPEPKEPVQYTTKIVTRRMPLVVQQPETPAGPVQVVLDEQALQANQKRMEEIRSRIAELQKKIDSAQLVAPIAGTVTEIGEDAIWIEPLPSVGN